MINNTALINTNIRSKFILTLMFVIISLFPIFKGGNYPGVMALFILSTAFIFLLSVPDFKADRDKPWLVVWGVFSAAVLIHAFLYPFVFVNERFFINGLDPQVAEEVNSRHFSKMRMIEVWSFFTSMWIFAWRMSVLKLASVKLVLLALFLASSFQAFFGLVYFVSGATSILGLWEKQHYLADATGTFVNRNHFAGMLAISAPLVLSGLLMPKPLLLSFLSKNNRLVIAVCYLIVLMLALISSHSRMGLMVAILGLVSCYILMNRVNASSNKSLARIKFFSVFVFLLLFSLWFGIDDILRRYADLEDGNSRFDVWKAMLSKVPLDVWFYGAGPGSFESVFQTIKPSNFSVRFIYAHNDYLEFVFEFGLLFSFLILSSIAYWFRCNRLNLNCKSYFRAGIYASFVVIGFHSMVDFNLQIPASALYFWLAFGLLANSETMSYGADDGLLEGGRARKGVGNIKSKRARSKQSRLPKTKQEWVRFFRSD